MAKIKITTAQNLDLEFELANIGDRALAWLLDMLIMFLISLICLLIIQMSVGHFTTSGMILAMLPATFYHLLLEIFLNGQSIGKKSVGIRVIKIDGSQPSIGSYIMRWVFRILDCFLPLYCTPGILSIIISGQGQRIGDVVAGTTVIHTSRKSFLKDTMFRRPDQGYKAMFPQVMHLNDRDINTMQEVINLFLKTNNIRVLNHCANRTCEVLNVHPAGLNALQFLQTIIHDYNAVH